MIIYCNIRNKNQNGKELIIFESILNLYLMLHDFKRGVLFENYNTK